MWGARSYCERALQLPSAAAKTVLGAITNYFADGEILDYDCVT